MATKPTVLLAEPTQLSILLAEDDGEMRSLVAAMLRGEGYRVEEAASGADLTRAIAARLDRRHGAPLDLVVSDVRMPGPSGLQVLEALRTVDWATPVVVMTAFGDEDLRAEALRLGAAAVLDKPFALEDLKRTVRRLIGTAIAQ